MSFGEEFSFVFGRYGIYILIAAVIAYLIGSINTSIITTRKGALRVMPEEKEIAGLLGK